MRTERIRHRIGAAFAGLSLLVTAGCVVRTGLIVLSEAVGLKPIVVALVSEDPLKVVNPFTAYDPLRDALSAELKRPVALDTCIPFQMTGLLKEGFYQFAVLTPLQYAQLGERERFPVVAIPADAAGRKERYAVIVVAPNSSAQTPADLRGKVFAFGPAGDPVAHHAAIAALRTAGLGENDIQKELVPLPGLKHMPNGRGVAQSVIAGSSDAGFVDVADWESFPESAVGDIEPAKSKLRVIGRTPAVPLRLIVASPKTDVTVVNAVKAALLGVNARKPEALKPLNESAYVEPTAEQVAQAAALGPYFAPPTAPARR